MGHVGLDIVLRVLFTEIILRYPPESVSSDYEETSINLTYVR